MSSTATTVLARSSEQIAAQLTAVPQWATSLVDVAYAHRIGHERYRFGLLAGRRTEDVLVAVRWDQRRQRLSWRGFDGPPWSGSLRLTAVDAGRTQVDLQVLAQPRHALGALGEMLVGASRNLAGELHALLDAALAVVEPARPHLPVPAPRRSVDGVPQPRAAVTSSAETVAR